MILKGFKELILKVLGCSLAKRPARLYHVANIPSNFQYMLLQWSYRSGEYKN